MPGGRGCMCITSHYQVGRGVWRAPRRIIGIGAVTVAENGVI